MVGVNGGLFLVRFLGVGDCCCGFGGGGFFFGLVLCDFGFFVWLFWFVLWVGLGGCVIFFYVSLFGWVGVWVFCLGFFGFVLCFDFVGFFVSESFIWGDCIAVFWWVIGCG